MRKIFIALCYVLLLSSLGMPAAADRAELSEDRAFFPPVIMYHDIKTEPQNNFDVLIEDFCAQLDWLKEEGYETLSINDFIHYLSQDSFPKKSVLLTFDDGYNGIYNYAMPELKKRGMKATFFITSSMVGVLDTTYPHVTEEELKAMAADELFSIASHTVSHLHLDELSPEERDYELNESKKALEELIGKKILAIAYPYGDYNEEVIAAVKDSGYEVAFAVQDKGLCNMPAHYSIPRINMGLDLANDNQKLFKEYVQNYKNMPEEAFAERWKPLSEFRRGRINAIFQLFRL